MLARTHLAIGSAATAGIAVRLGYCPDAIGWGALLIGSLFPDIDVRSSVISRPGTLLSYVVDRPLQKLLDAAAALVLGVFRFFVRHRGLTHWALWPVLIAVTGSLLELDWLNWFAWGYAWHLAADAFTCEGVPLFKPIFRSNISCFGLRTGSAGEIVLSFILWLFVAACAASYSGLLSRAAGLIAGLL